MEISSQIQMKCQIHENKIIEWIKVNDIQKQQGGIFYCSKCVNQDVEFQRKSFLYLEDLNLINKSPIVQCWPPLNDNSIISKIIQLTSQNQNTESITKDIDDFIEKFKKEINQKLDQIKKEMIIKVNNLPNNQNNIIQSYQKLARLDDLKNILFNKDLNSIQKEEKYRALLIQIQQKNTENQEALNQSFNNYKNNQEYIDFNLPKQIQSSVYHFIDSLDFFNLNLPQFNHINQDDNLKEKQNDKSQQLMKLISNKSNQCYQTFLDQIQNMLHPITALIDRIQFDNAFLPDKQPINFDQLNEKQLSIIDDLTKHLIICQNDQEYVNNTKQSRNIKDIIYVLSKQKNIMNTKNNQFINEFESCLINFYPFIQQIKSNHNFDFNHQNTEINILENLSILVGKWNNGEQNMNITKNENNHITLRINTSGSWANCIGDFILDANRKYVFRFLFSNQTQDLKHVMLGLTRDTTKDKTNGYSDKLSSYFYINQNHKISKAYGIGKGIKGDFNRLKEIKMVEMRVCINEGQLEILDYPGYNNHLALDDQYIANLKSYKDLRLYIGMYDQNIDVTLTDAFYIKN